ncbi:MAG: N-acetylmuramoyl-L-alanine amidase [Candidatus Moraniibacteriota bacterium]
MTAKQRKISFLSVSLLLVVGAVSFGFWYSAGSKQTEFTQEAPETKDLADQSEEQTSAPEPVTEAQPEPQAESGQATDDVLLPPLPKSGEKPDAQPKASSLSITNRLMSSGFAAKTSRTIDTIILHSTYNSLGGDQYSVSKIIDIYKSYGVSAHYLIGRDGTIYRLVEEKNVSYHAGESRVPDGRTNVNDFSIGIELINNDKGDEYTDAQYAAVRALVADIKKRYSIKYVLGHDDIAPDRKSDPWNFDWKKL